MPCWHYTRDASCRNVVVCVTMTLSEDAIIRRYIIFLDKVTVNVLEVAVQHSCQLRVFLDSIWIVWHNISWWQHTKAVVWWCSHIRCRHGDDRKYLNHIRSFKCRQSHYGRPKSRRSYLPPELSIKKIYNMWLVGRRAPPGGKKQHSCSYQKYRKIFCAIGLTFASEN